MYDFLRISVSEPKKDTYEIFPSFDVIQGKDLMTRGGDFYCIWSESLGRWSKDEQTVINEVDKELWNYADKFRELHPDSKVRVKLMRDGDSKMINKFHEYTKSQLRDNFIQLDQCVVAQNDKPCRENYSSITLPYSIEEGDISAWDELVSITYDPKERHKIEWGLGSVFAGGEHQKCIVIYGPPGSGKGTIFKVTNWMLRELCAAFKASILGSSSNQFPFEAFKHGPLVAIDPDADLSKIEDNTNFNSIISHEPVLVNEKGKATYTNTFNTLLMAGTNRPVKITEAKSGLIRRLIDVVPSGRTVDSRKYKRLMKHIKMELGAIAYHCKQVYLEDPYYYEDYIPTRMMGATNDFYNFVNDNYFEFKKEDGISLKRAYEKYKLYCEDVNTFAVKRTIFSEELKNYFEEFRERYTKDGVTYSSYYKGFIADKFESREGSKNEEVKEEDNWLIFDCEESILDKEFKDCLAQYANEDGYPSVKWDKCTTKLKDLDTHKLHYVRGYETHVFIDFDIPDENGNKSLEKNIEAARKFPKTYAELSKSGCGIHLHYIYTGDASKLSRLYDDHIEIKVFVGKSSLRRKLSKCNNLPISTISSGLPIKEEKKVIDFSIKNEKQLRTMIIKNLLKEYHGYTKPSIDYIKKLLDDAYNSGISYNVTDMYNEILAFAFSSTNQSDICLKTVAEMKFKSEEGAVNDIIPQPEEDKTIVFYDLEVFPNLLLVNWKIAGEGKSVNRMINPTPDQIEELFDMKLVGFNDRRYDRHILYAAWQGYSNEQIYDISKRIISGDNSAFFAKAYNLGYTDVYDFSTDKMSLKKWEIKLGIHHQELGLPWDKPVDPSLWEKVAEYCDNDVIATEAVFNHLKGDFAARQIQVDIVKALHGIDASVNDTTNTLSEKIIFGRDKKKNFNWRDMSKPVHSSQYEEYREKFGEDYIFRVFDADGLPLYRDYIPGEVLPEGYSILPFFKGYEFNQYKPKGEKSIYLGEYVGEGGRVFGRHGLWYKVWDGDITSQHPHSLWMERMLGKVASKRFYDIVQARVFIKRKDFESAGKLLNGVLKPYLTEELAGDLAQALKIVINSIYGLTSASFSNAFKDDRNIDNMVAKRGALFMTLLKQEVEKQGYIVCHIKTDSIKIPNATQEIIDFVCKFGKEYGYNFETEAEFSKFALLTDADYVGKLEKPEKNKKTGADIWWLAKGKRFEKTPYLWKNLFSKEPIEFQDMCKVFSVSKGDLYLDFNENLPDVAYLEKELAKLEDMYKKGKLSDVSFEEMMLEGDYEYQIEQGHDLHFIGRVGNFVPVLPGEGGGVLYRVNEGKRYAATESTGYRWMEAEIAKELNKKVDLSFWQKQIDSVVEAIEKTCECGFDEFVS